DAWLELDADAEGRVIVHTGEGRAFQTGVDVSEIAGDGVGFARYRDDMERFDLHFTAWHQKVWKPVITAVNGICAGGGFHWIADATIVTPASSPAFFCAPATPNRDRRLRPPVLRPPHLDRPGRVAGGHRADPQDPRRGGHAHGVRRPPRAHVGRTGLRAGDDQPDRGPAGGAAGGRPGAGREDRPQLAGGDGGHQAGPLGGAGDGADRSLPGRCPGAGVDVGPPGPDRGPAGLRREARGPVVATLLDAVLVEPDETLVHLGDQAWTRREVEAMAPELAIEPGAVVAVQLPNGPELIATLFAVWAAGGVYVPLNPRAAAGEVA